MNSDIALLELIQNAAQKYDEADELVNKIDEFCEKISENQQEQDLILSDLYHEIENADLSDEQMANIGKQIKKHRIARRKLDNANIIRNEYERQKSKLSIKEQRPFFRNYIKQVIGRLNQPYKNRILTKEEIENLKNITSENKKVKKSTKIDIQKLKEEYLKGTKQIQLATMFNCS